MLKIGEFAILSSISIPMLRNYDKIGLLEPSYVDSNGYRYYDKEQLVFANQLMRLRSMGFSLDEIKLIKEKPELERVLLSNKLVEKNNEIKKIERQIKRIEKAIDLSDNVYPVIQREALERRVVFYRGLIDEHHDEGLLWAQLVEHCKDMNISLKPHSPSYAIYYGETDNGQYDVEVQIEADTKDAKKVATRQMVTVMFKGEYAQISRVNRVLAEWLENNDAEIIGPMETIYYNSPGNGAIDKDYVTEICVPIKKRS